MKNKVEKKILEFPGSPLVRHLPASAEDAVWEDSTCPGAAKPVFHDQGSHCNEKRSYYTWRGAPLLSQLEKACVQPKIHIFLKEPLKKDEKVVGLEMTDDFDRSSLRGVGETVRGGRLEKGTVVEKVSHLPSWAWL